MKTTWTVSPAWMLAVSAAMGQLPSFMARTLNQQAVAVPGGLPAERTLAVITFHSSQRGPDAGHARLMPVFTDRARFVRSAGLRGTDAVYAVVINRQGEVLARAEGAFDGAKADKLRETLQPQDAHEASRPPAGASPKVK